MVTDAGMVPVVLDTDLGTDVDDLLALALLAAEPRVELVAVTTVYGDTALRARMAARVLRVLGRPEVAVHAGTGTPRSGRAVWWAGHEGSGLAGLDREQISPTGGVDALLAAARRHPGELVVIAIGPLTNVASALDRDPGWATALRQLMVMGGEFAAREPEHNLRSDVAAARQVLASGIPSQFVGLDVTTKVWFDQADLTAVTSSGTAAARLLEDQVRRWWRYLDQPRNHPHDPLAVLARLEPELFTWARCRWRVVEQDDRLGVLEPAAGPPVVEYASGVDAGAARASIQRRLSTAVAG